MVSIWKTLGIEPTDNISTIKKAYAKLLKIHHPEKDPEGYQGLREAYDRAIKLAKEMKANPAPAQEIQFEDSDNFRIEESISTQLILNNEVAATQAIKTTVHPVQEFIDKAEELYGDYFKRIDKKNWEELLNSDVIWDAQYFSMLKERLIDFFQSHYHLPPSIWELVDSVFRFNEQKDELMYEYDEDEVEFLLENINEKRAMGYDIFKQGDVLEFDRYFKYREYALEALMEDDPEEAERYLDQAYNLYKEDPDLLRMWGIYYMRNTNNEQALKSFNSLLAIRTNDIDGLLHRARIYFENGQYAEARRDCEHILSFDDKNLETLFIMVQCSAKEENWEDVASICKKADEIDSHHFEFYTYGNLSYKMLKKRDVPVRELGLKIALRNAILYFIAIFIYVFARRTWFYWGLFFVALIIDIPFKFAGFLLIPIIWEAWKAFSLKII